MLKYFVIISIAITLGILVKNGIAFLITKTFSISKQKIIINLLEIIIASVLLSIMMLLTEKHKDISFFIAPLFLVLVSTYRFTIIPIKHLIYHKKNETSIDIEKKLVNKGFNYKVRTIKLKKPNAFATGILPFYKLIFIDEKILNELTEEQALSIIYHEVGHHELYHLKKMLLINILISIVGFYVLRLNVENPYYVLLFIVIFGLVFSFSTTKIQYNYEFQADTFSAKINSKKNLIEALKNLDILFNNRISKGGISHPTLLKRIKNINNEK